MTRLLKLLLINIFISISWTYSLSINISTSNHYYYNNQEENVSPIIASITDGNGDYYYEWQEKLSLSDNCSSVSDEYNTVSTNIQIYPNTLLFNYSGDLTRCYRLKITNNNNIYISNVLTIKLYRNKNSIPQINQNNLRLANVNENIDNTQDSDIPSITYQPRPDNAYWKCGDQIDKLNIVIDNYQDNYTYQWQVSTEKEVSRITNSTFINISGETNTVYTPVLNNPNGEKHYYRVKIISKATNKNYYSNVVMRYQCPTNSISEENNRQYIEKLPYLFIKLKSEYTNSLLNLSNETRQEKLRIQILNNYNNVEQMMNSVYDGDREITLQVSGLLGTTTRKIKIKDILIEYANIKENKEEDFFKIKVIGDKEWEEKSSPKYGKYKSTDILDGLMMLLNNNNYIESSEYVTFNINVGRKTWLCEEQIFYIELQPGQIEPITIWDRLSFLCDNGYGGNGKLKGQIYIESIINTISSSTREIIFSIFPSPISTYLLNEDNGHWSCDKDKDSMYFFGFLSNVIKDKDLKFKFEDDNKYKLYNNTNSKMVESCIKTTLNNYTRKYIESYFFQGFGKAVDALANLYNSLERLIRRTATLTTIRNGDEVSFTIKRPLGGTFSYYQLSCYYNGFDNTITDANTVSSTNEYQFSKKGFDVNTEYQCIVRVGIQYKYMTKWSLISLVHKSSTTTSGTTSYLSKIKTIYQEVSQALIQYTFLTTSAQEIPHIYDNPLAINNFDPNTFDTDKFMTVSTTTNNSTATINILSQNNIQLQAVSQTPTLTTTAWSGEEIGFVINKPSGSAFNYYELECYYNNNNNYLYDYTTLSSATNYISFSRLGFNINTTYTCRVRAQVPNNTISAWSSTSIVRTSSALAYPSITSTSMTSDSITFRINKRGDIDFDEYYIYCSYNNGNNYKDTTGWQHTLSYVDTSSVSYTLIGLSPNTTYNCVAKIRNIPTYTSSNDSNVIQVVTLSSSPSSPNIWPVQSIGNNQISIAWTPLNNVIYYSIETAQSSCLSNIHSSCWTEIATTTNSSHIITNLINNTQYAIRIRAYNGLYSSYSYIIYGTPSEGQYDVNTNTDAWGLRAINANNAWNITQGSDNIKVAVIDTGVDIYHPDFWENIDKDCPVTSFTNRERIISNYIPSEPCDFSKSNIWENSGEVGLTYVRKSLIPLDNSCVTTNDLIYYKQNNGCDDDGNGYVDDVHGANFGSLLGNFNANDSVTNVIDTDGHGTNVAGIIAAYNNNIGVRGVAKVKIVPVRAIGVNADQYLYSDDGAFDYVTKIQKNNNTYIKSNIVNGSYYLYNDLKIKNEIISTAINKLKNLRNNNITPIFISGNFNLNINRIDNYTDSDKYGKFLQGMYDDAIVVGAVDPQYNRANCYYTCTSGYGNKLDIVAPGVNIYSNLSKINMYDYTSKYSYYSGTSQAAPHISGIVALMKSVNNNLSNEQIRQILHFTATDLNSGIGGDCSIIVGFDICTGYGLANAYKAVWISNSYNYLIENGITTYLSNILTPHISSPDVGFIQTSSSTIDIIGSIGNNNNLYSFNIKWVRDTSSTGNPTSTSNWSNTGITLSNLNSISSNINNENTLATINPCSLGEGSYTFRLQAINSNNQTFEFYITGIYITSLQSISLCQIGNTINGVLYHHSFTSKSISGAHNLPYQQRY